jgi:hypothetical protein
MTRMLDDRIAEELDRIAADRERAGDVPEGPPRTLEEVFELEREVLASMPRAAPINPVADAEQKWRARRDAILRLRAAEKRSLRSGRGPPGG